MKLRTARGNNKITVKTIVIYIGEERFRLSETNEGKLLINKISDGMSDTININPCVANEIELS